jgi:glycosyltransferase involved in cell wall biosynthesis
MYFMKILKTCLSHSWGGLEMEAIKISSKLTEHGYDVYLMIPAGSRLEREVKNFNNKIKTISISGNYFSKLKTVIKILKKEKYDVIHTHLSHDLGLLVPALYLSGLKSKLFLTKHMASGIGKKDFLHRFFYNRIDGIFAISSYIKDNVLKTCPIKKEKVHLIPNGIDLLKYFPGKYDKNTIREKFGIKKNSVVIGLIGRISPLKGHKEFILAAKKLKSLMPDAIYLVAGGASYGEESYENEIKNTVKDLDLDSQFRFLGFRKDIPEILAALDILAFPSYEESFGLTLLESMAMQVPVVAVGNAGILDIITNDESGILIPPKDADALASGILKIYNNQNTKNKIVREGRLRVEKQFDLNKIMVEYERFYSYSSFAYFLYSALM